MTRRSLWIGFSAFALALVGALAVIRTESGESPSAAGGPRRELLRVRYPIPALRASMGPFVAAEAKGWYAAEGIDVRFGYGGSGTNPVAMLLQGQDDVGVLGGPDTMLVANGNGGDFVAIAVLHHNADFVCLVTLASSGIQRVEQLDGKRVGMFPGHISIDVLQSFFRAAGIHVQEVNVGYDYGQLIGGQIEAQWAFTTAAAVELPEKGIAVNVISPATRGIRTHGYTVFVRRGVLAAKRDLVRRFLNATFKGVVYVREHRADAASLLVAADSTGSLEQAQVERRLAELEPVTPTFDPLPPGHMDEEMFATTYDRLNAAGIIQHPYDVRQSFDTSLLEEIHGPRMHASAAAPSHGR